MSKIFSFFLFVLLLLEQAMTVIIFVKKRQLKIQQIVEQKIRPKLLKVRILPVKNGFDSWPIISTSNIVNYNQMYWLVPIEPFAGPLNFSYNSSFLNLEVNPTKPVAANWKFNLVGDYTYVIESLSFSGAAIDTNFNTSLSSRYVFQPVSLQKMTQHFQVIQNGSFYQLKSVHSGLCMAFTNPVTQNTCDTNAAIQNFKLAVDWNSFTLNP